MDTLRIGKIIRHPQHRDAVHMAIAPMEAATMLKAGEHVGIENGKAVRHTKHIGIVDPFLTCDAVKKGEQFWLFLYPGSITSLRHDWTHPDFFAENAPPLDVSLSEKWLRNFAQGEGVSSPFSRSCCSPRRSTPSGTSTPVGITGLRFRRVQEAGNNKFRCSAGSRRGLTSQTRHETGLTTLTLCSTYEFMLNALHRIQNEGQNIPSGVRPAFRHPRVLH